MSTLPSWAKDDTEQIAPKINTKQAELGAEDEESRLLKARQGNDDEEPEPEESETSFYMILAMKLLTVIAALCLCGSIIYDIVTVSMGVEKYILHGYTAVFCLGIVLIEIEVPFLVRRLSLFMDSWFVKGCFYAYIGLSSYDEDAALSLFTNIAAYLMMATGGLFTIGGILCLNPNSRGRASTTAQRGS